MPEINEKVKQQEKYYEQRKKDINKELSQLIEVRNDLSSISSAILTAKRYCNTIEKRAEREKDKLKGKGKGKK